MHVILAPTDFSAAAANAVSYAAELAHLTGARLVLLHVFHLPIPPTEFPIAVATDDELTAGALKQLHVVEQELQQRFNGTLKTQCEARCGLATDAIAEVAEELPANLVVAGMTGGGVLKRRLLGSVSTSLMHALKCPLLVLETHCTFTPPKTILLACDYEFMPTTTLLQPVLELQQLFGAHIKLVHVKDDPQKATTADELTEALKLELTLKGVPHSFHTISNEDTEEGLALFQISHNTDWLVMIVRKHGWLHNLINESHTQRMAFQTNVPLLTVQEI